jgi:hypothetical protein
VTPWLSVVIPTVGRDTLEQTLDSLAAQPESSGVEVVVVADTHGGFTAQLEQARRLTRSRDHVWLELDAGLHCVGQPQRTMGARAATAAWVWFSQDDNISAKDALATIEMATDQQVRPRPLFFKMRTYWGDVVWRSPYLALGNIDADCMVFPRHIAHAVTWGLRYEGDYDAAIEAVTLSNNDVAWINEVVSIGRPSPKERWWSLP